MAVLLAAGTRALVRLDGRPGVVIGVFSYDPDNPDDEPVYTVRHDDHGSIVYSGQSALDVQSVTEVPEVPEAASVSEPPADELPADEPPVEDEPVAPPNSSTRKGRTASKPACAILMTNPTGGA